MTTPPRDLHDETDVRFQRRQWRLERVGWVAITLITLATVLGLFGGPGILTRTMAASEAVPLRVEYPRFARLQAPMSLLVEFDTEAIRDGRATLWLSRSYLDAVEVVSVFPQPQTSLTMADGVQLIFTVAQSTSAPMVALTLHPTRAGTVGGALGADADRALSIRHIVCP